MAKRSILVVDDDAAWGRIAAELFAAYKYTAYTAATCAEAVKLLARKKVDCILLDYHLTDGKADGVSLAVRNSAKLKNTPIVIISGDEQAESVSYLQCKADSFVLKGAQFEKVLAVVEGAIRQAEDGNGTAAKA